jgi:hypothetical protein
MHDPICKRSGNANEFLDIGRTHPKLILAGNSVHNCQIPVMLRGVALKT